MLIFLPLDVDFPPILKYDGKWKKNWLLEKRKILKILKYPHKMWFGKFRIACTKTI